MYVWVRVGLYWVRHMDGFPWDRDQAVYVRIQTEKEVPETLLEVLREWMC